MRAVRAGGGEFVAGELEVKEEFLGEGALVRQVTQDALQAQAFKENGVVHGMNHSFSDSSGSSSRSSSWAARRMARMR